MCCAILWSGHAPLYVSLTPTQCGHLHLELLAAEFHLTRHATPVVTRANSNHGDQDSNITKYQGGQSYDKYYQKK